MTQEWLHDSAAVALAQEHIQARGARTMETDINELAANIYDGQSVTVMEYPSAAAYVNDLLDLAHDEGWTDDLDGDQLVELEEELMRHAEADLDPPKRLDA